MTTITLELPPQVYERLTRIASQRHISVEQVAEEWLVEVPSAPHPQPATERERAIAALRAAGLLTELSPTEKARAAQSTLTLDEARAILDRAGGTPLSEIILEMRGSKE